MFGYNLACMLQVWGSIVCVRALASLHVSCELTRSPQGVNLSTAALQPM